MAVNEPKPQTQTQRILSLFRAKGTVTNRELNEICFRYAARIHEMRANGHPITTKQIKPGLYHYTYGRQG